MALDIRGDLVRLFTDVIDIESVSDNEGPLADEVETALRAVPHLTVSRDGDTVIARTDLGRAERVVIAGHLDTVPVAGNLPSRREGDLVYGRGSVDMKGGIAVMLACAAALDAPTRDVTWVFYDHEEVEQARNALGRIAPAKMAGDFAILMEPTDAGVEGGCQGVLTFRITLRGKASHAARPWLGHNAIHEAFDVLARLMRYKPREVDVDGLAYKESLSAVRIEGGIANNVIPDRCVVTVNHRFAPDRDVEAAKASCKQLFIGYDLEFIDAAPAARPGLDRPIARDFLAATGATPRAKYGWTDVARFATFGIPAVNFGPGDPGKAHADDECCDVAQLVSCRDALLAFLRGQ